MKNFGDLSLLKLSFFKKGEEKNNYTEGCIQLKPLTCRTLDIEELARLPKNTFGYAYWEFMHRNKLSPLNFTDRVAHIINCYPVSSRYTRVHDMIHTLLDFGPDFEGELGVYSFILQQNYSVLLNRAAKTARIFTRTFKPWAWKSLNKAENRGRELAKDAKILILEKLEEFLSEDLESLRKRLLPHYTKE